MSDICFDKLGLNLMEMRCPHCHATQYLRSGMLSVQPCLTRCSACKKLLVCQLSVKTKPNNVLLSLDIHAVADNAAEVAPT